MLNLRTHFQHVILIVFNYIVFAHEPEFNWWVKHPQGTHHYFEISTFVSRISHFFTKRRLFATHSLPLHYTGGLSENGGSCEKMSVLVLTSFRCWHFSFGLTLWSDETRKCFVRVISSGNVFFKDFLGTTSQALHEGELTHVSEISSAVTVRNLIDAQSLANFMQGWAATDITALDSNRFRH